jgi:hypothetical protein
MPNDELTPVFNIRGANNILEFSSNSKTYNDGQFSEIPVWI